LNWLLAPTLLIDKSQPQIGLFRPATVLASPEKQCRGATQGAVQMP